MTDFACEAGQAPAPSTPDGKVNAIYVAVDAGACEGSPAGAPNAVEVAIRYGYPVFMPFLSEITGDHIYMTATVTDTILQPQCP